MRRICLWHIIVLITLCGYIYFYRGMLQGLLPIPMDTLVGLYHPFRDLYFPEFPNGIPFKNFLLTDPVRQIIPWKELSISQLSQGSLPLWNPYEMTGKPLLGNFQSSPFYPLNALLLFQPFKYGWSIFILLQQVLAALFMFMYLRTQKISRPVSIFGAFIFSFSGFMIAWLEWGTLGHTFLWLPLILLAVEKISQNKVSKKIYGLYIVSLSASLFAGHLQTFVYIAAISFAYFLLRLQDVEKGKRLRKFGLYIVLNSLFAALTAVQWVPTLTFIMHSARDIDQSLSVPGWFIPPQHLLQFFAPDFFGNPATLNYWGVWNYAEFLGYIGIIPLTLALLTLGSKSKKTLFFQGIIAVSLLFAVANPITESLYSLQIPFFSSAQPTRLIGPVSFALTVLSVFGLKDVLEKRVFKKLAVISAAWVVFLMLVWGTLIINTFGIPQTDLSVTKRNIILPSLLLGGGAIGMLSLQILQKKKRLVSGIFVLIVVLTVFDLTRTAQKFTPFARAEYFYPATRVTEFLQNDTEVFRIATTDDRILAPNIATYYRIQSVEGYDPLYLKNYAKAIALNERQEPNINPPYGFNRIITPRNYSTQLIDFLNVKYILTLTDIENEKFRKVAEEGQTKVYENMEVFSRAFFVEELVQADTDSEIARRMKESDLSRVAFTTEDIEGSSFATGSAKIEKYSENEIVVTTSTEAEAFLVVSDAHYPTWKVKINGEKSKIYKVNLAFRGILVPAGENEIIFYTTLY